MNIYQLRYYIAVVEEGTISAAARKLNLSQPPLSTQIKLLEERSCLYAVRARSR